MVVIISWWKYVLLPAQDPFFSFPFGSQASPTFGPCGLGGVTSTPDQQEFSMPLATEAVSHLRLLLHLSGKKWFIFISKLSLQSREGW